MLGRHGFSLADLLEVGLRYCDHRLARLAPTWPSGALARDLPEPEDELLAQRVKRIARTPAFVTEEEVAVAGVLAPPEAWIAACTHPEQARAAWRWATVAGAGLSIDLHPSAQTLGRALAVDVATAVHAVPAALVLSALAAATAYLAAEAAEDEDSLGRVQAVTERRAFSILRTSGRLDPERLDLDLPAVPSSPGVGLGMVLVPGHRHAFVVGTASMLLQLLGIFAEFERGLLIDRITKGFERKAARGEWLGGPGPFGYHVDPATKSLVPDPKEAATVQKIFSAYADEHLGATALANQLSGAGLRNRGDRLWSNQTVLRVLRNPVYVGKISHGDEVYEGKHPSIIEGDLFARARALLDERAALVENRAPNTSDYLLTGLLRCHACGGAYFGAGTKGRNGFYRYYACRNRQTKGTYGCQSTRIPAEDLEAAVIDDLIRILSRSDLFEQAITAAIAEVMDSRPCLESELASTEAQLRDTETGLNHYLRAFETGEMPAAICSPRVTELTQRRDELAAHRKKLACQIEAASPQLPTPDQLRSLCAEIRRTIDSGNPDAVKQLLRELIDRVEITPDRHAYPFFWVPAGGETGTPSGKPGPDAPPVPAHQGDTGWLFVTSRHVRGGALSVFEPDGTAGTAEPGAEGRRSGSLESHCCFRPPPGLQGSTRRTPRSLK
ncbi:MAG: recombinase family protein [Acidimicrobiales bacterium]